MRTRGSNQTKAIAMSTCQKGLCWAALGIAVGVLPEEVGEQ